MAFCDMHTHTVYSDDAYCLTLPLCRRAAERGLHAIALTEHCDFFPDGLLRHYNVFKEKSEARIAQAREELGAGLKILKGIELGQPHINPKLTAEFMAENEFDVVISSLHHLRGIINIHDMVFAGQDECDKTFEEYFTEMAVMASQCDFNILGHIDYPVRYMRPAFTRDISLIYYRELIRPVLKTCAEKGIAVEVNTAGMRRWLGVPGPAAWVFADFRELGGRYVTIGSDAHSVHHCASGFEEAKRLLSAAGFDKTVYFENREAHFLPL